MRTSPRFRPFVFFLPREPCILHPAPRTLHPIPLLNRARQTDRPVDMTDKTTHGDRDMADNSLGADSWSRYGMVWYGTYGMGWGQESQKSHLSGNSHYQPPYGPYPGRLEPGWDNWMGSGESYPWTLSYAYNYIHTQAVGKSTLSRM